MDSFVTNITRKRFLISFISAIFIIYPNIIYLPWELARQADLLHKLSYGGFLTTKFLFFWVVLILLTHYNLNKALTFPLKKRFLHNALISIGAYVVSLALFRLFKHYGICDFFGSIVVFQFLVICSLCSLIGHIAMMYLKQQEKEAEIQQLKMENLQSRCDALTNQINPHFFFNSLSGITSLIRKRDDSKTLQYVEELSDIFRYILQSEHKGMVTLQEELNFIEAFRYVMEVRFANKLSFSIQVDESKQNTLTLPVLSLLPLVENVVIHNRIDIDHKMEIAIYLNSQDELVISNPIFPKSTHPRTNGTGLKNVENRFQLLTNRKIRIEPTDKTFRVYLPLK